MTRYILHGGRTDKAPDGGKLLCDVIVEGLVRPARILVCLFAQPRENWERKFAENQQFFTQHLGTKISINLAQPDTFEKQIAKADVVYIKGGDDVLLEHYLNKYDDLPALFAGKTVVGSSAGADFLSTAYWTCDRRQVREGSGLVPVKFIPHFESVDYALDDPRGPINWVRALADLEAFDGPLPIYAAREGEFEVFEA